MTYALAEIIIKQSSREIKLTERYLPEKSECMPDKKIFLARARTRYSKEIRDDPDFIHHVNNLFLVALEKIEPVVYYSTVQVSMLPDELIPSIFKGAKSVTILLSTLGSSVDSLITEFLDEGRTFDAFIADAWASESLEAFNEKFDKKLRKRFGRGTMRFSPGYGDIDLRMNKYIVEEFLKIDQIKVLDSGVMIPRKTTTCMIGWYDEKK